MINVDELSEQELKEALKKKGEQKQKSRDAYKDLCNDSVGIIAKGLLDCYVTLSVAKLAAFEDLKVLLDAKKEVFGVRDNQQSHTFSDDKGNFIKYGFRINEDWDDSVSAGIEKVNEYLSSLAKDEDSANLVLAIRLLLKRDKKGNLKASRVIELRQWADEINNPILTDGVDIIQRAYKPVYSSFFIELQITDPQGKKIGVPLSLSSVPFPEGTNIDELFPVHEKYKVV